MSEADMRPESIETAAHHGPVTSVPPAAGRVPSKVRTLGLELLVIFVGVWLALAAEAWRDRREDERRAARITGALQADLDDLTTWYKTWRDSITVEYDRWRSARSAGERLPLFYVRMPGSEEGGLVSWHVALASNALEVLDPELIFEIGRVSRELNGKGARFARYMSLTELRVFPQLASGPDAFYDSNGNLKAKFSAHLKLLDELLEEFDIACDGLPS